MTDPEHPPEKHVEVFPPPDEEEPPEPSFKQYFVGWGLIFLALVALAEHADREVEPHAGGSLPSGFSHFHSSALLS